ncbi:hypothetical protein SPI_02405 [Niveomyces insectorum RCEF 264]|uniref:Ribosomal protein s17 n=1 Tax=Niveomyces insectorum RCEF 264 TaxID=1081102 RepID=A0A162KBG3_9HYPO|nr:hypothetical protein SPI_02405 [Niveomyces insectorum RCEF 264]
MKWSALVLTPTALAVAATLPSSRSASPVLVAPRQGISNSSRCLAPDAIQTASTRTGQEAGTLGLSPGQSPSETDDANFINFCAGRTLTNGRQLAASSCNGVPMGRLPARSHMVAALITAPAPGARLPPHTAFNVTIQTMHLRAGHLANPQTNYYTAPQDLDENGDVLGHCHVTVQALNPVNDTDRDKQQPPDPTHFVYFKGIDDAGTDGRLQTAVTGGLPVGAYRVCTMIAARNHQPVLMPVAQRGAQDDCVRFEVADAAAAAA